MRLVGYSTALALLVNPFDWIGGAMLCPAWMMLVSLVILVRRKRAPAGSGGALTAA